MTVPLTFAAAALHPSMPDLALPGRRTRARVTRGRLALLVGAVVLAQVVIVIEWVRGRPIEYPVVAGAGILMSLLTFVRFGGMARDMAVQHERRRAAIQVVQAPRVLCMDGINSMTGNPPDLPAFAALAREHDALLYVDDAHGFGVLGERDGYDPSPFGRRATPSSASSASPTTTSS